MSSRVLLIEIGRIIDIADEMRISHDGMVVKMSASTAKDILASFGSLVSPNNEGEPNSLWGVPLEINDSQPYGYVRVMQDDMLIGAIWG